MNAIGDTPDALNGEGFQAYALGYITWEKSSELSRADFDKLVINAVQSVDMSKLSPEEKSAIDAHLTKVKQMMVKAFDLGRRDAKMSPCPY
jgi:hypothetical protein